MKSREVKDKTMPSNYDRAKPEWSYDIVNTDKTARSHETAPCCVIVEKVKLLSNVFCCMVVVDEDEVKGWPLIGREKVYSVNVQDSDALQVEAGSRSFLPALFVEFKGDKGAAFRGSEM